MTIYIYNTLVHLVTDSVLVKTVSSPISESELILTGPAGYVFWQVLGTSDSTVYEY